MSISQKNVGFFTRKFKSRRGLKFATDLLYNIIKKVRDGFGNYSSGFQLMNFFVFCLAKNGPKSMISGQAKDNNLHRPQKPAEQLLYPFLTFRWSVANFSPLLLLVFRKKNPTFFWDIDIFMKKYSKSKESKWPKLPGLSVLWQIAIFGKFLGPNTKLLGFYTYEIPQKWLF